MCVPIKGSFLGPQTLYLAYNLPVITETVKFFLFNSTISIFDLILFQSAKKERGSEFMELKAAEHIRR